MVLRLIVGDDPILVGEAISASVEELVGDGDRASCSSCSPRPTTATTMAIGSRPRCSTQFEPRRSRGATCRRLPSSQPVLRKDDYGPIINLLGEPPRPPTSYLLGSGASS